LLTCREVEDDDEDENDFRRGAQFLRMKGFCFSPVLSPPSFSSSLSVFDRCWLEAGYGRDSDRSFFA
jgi:hypothetical protein